LSSPSEVPGAPRRIDERLEILYGHLAREGLSATAERADLDDVDRSLLELLAAFGPEGEPSGRRRTRPPLYNVRPIDPPEAGRNA